MISVVIPCRDGAGVLAQQLDALLAQETSAEFEIVVADNGSTDGTADLVRSYADPRVRVVDAGRAPGANVARNIGITASKGEYILLTDADDVRRLADEAGQERREQQDHQHLQALRDEIAEQCHIASTSSSSTSAANTRVR